MHEPITKAQIAKIWASAHEIGLDRELLYLLVPRGSISAMTREEAARMIEHLTDLAGKRVGPAHPEAFLDEKPTRRKEGPNAVTQHQRNFIFFLLGRIGWLENPARMRGFLTKYAGVPSVERIPDRKRASAIIEALKAIRKRMRAGASDAQRN